MLIVISYSFLKLSDSNLKIYVRRCEKTLNHALVETFILYPSSQSRALNSELSALILHCILDGLYIYYLSYTLELTLFKVFEQCLTYKIAQLR